MKQVTAALAIVAAPLLLVGQAIAGGPAEAPGRPSPPPAFAQCGACHAVDRGASAGIGPSLAGVVGAKAGTRPGYAYSAAMKTAGFRWDRAKLDAYLANPQAVVPGTKMMIGGIADPARRAQIIAYLAALK